jgi:hypothetical protein
LAQVDWGRVVETWARSKTFYAQALEPCSLADLTWMVAGWRHEQSRFEGGAYLYDADHEDPMRARHDAEEVLLLMDQARVSKRGA